MAVNTTPSATSVIAATIQVVRTQPGRSIVQPPIATAASTISASAGTAR